jgi:hypothetical protein
MLFVGVPDVMGEVFERKEKEIKASSSSVGHM